MLKTLQLQIARKFEKAELKDYRGAIEWIDRALAIKSKPALHFNRGLALSALRELEAARDWYVRSLKLAP
jgi:tetratricopeptide (TPR) repeat protein